MRKPRKRQAELVPLWKCKGCGFKTVGALAGWKSWFGLLFRMEVGPWRCVPQTQLLHLPVGNGGIWYATSGHVGSRETRRVKMAGKLGVKMAGEAVVVTSAHQVARALGDTHFCPPGLLVPRTEREWGTLRG